MKAKWFLYATCACGVALSSDLVAGDDYIAASYMCAVDMSNVSVTTKGKGRLITEGSVYIFYSKANHELMNRGWEFVHQNSNLNKRELGVLWGHIVRYPPPELPYVGTLAEDFSVKNTQPLAGTFVGTEDLSGVVVTYAATAWTEGLCPEDALLNPPPQCLGADPEYACVFAPAGQPVTVIELEGTIDGYPFVED